MSQRLEGNSHLLCYCEWMRNQQFVLDPKKVPIALPGIACLRVSCIVLVCACEHARPVLPYVLNIDMIVRWFLVLLMSNVLYLV